MTSSQQFLWKLRGNYEVKPGVASIPERSTNPALQSHIKYVLLKTAEQAASVKVEIREGAEGKIVFVYPDILNVTTQEDSDCDIIPMTTSQHRRFLLCKTSQGRLALLGLFLGICGILIDGFLKIGGEMERPLFVIEAMTHVILLICATVLQLVGLSLVFIRALRKSDL